MIKFKVGGVPEHFNYPWHKGIERGDFTDLGIDIEWEDFSTGTGAMTKQLRDGELDMALLLTEGAIADISKGGNYKILQTYVESPLRWGIHVPAASQIQSIDDIKGKTYGISRYGSGSHLMAYVDADIRGWNTDLQFEIVNNMDGAVDSFADGSSQVFMWEKFTTKPLVDEGVFRRVGERPTPWPCFVLVVRDDVFEEYEEEVRLVGELITTLAEEVKADDETPIVISERYGLELHDVNQWLEETEWSEECVFRDELVELVGEALVKVGIIESVPKREFLVFS